MYAVPDPTPGTMALQKKGRGAEARPDEWHCASCSGTQPCPDRDQPAPVCDTCHPDGVATHTTELLSHDAALLTHARNFVVPDEKVDRVVVAATGVKLDTNAPPNRGVVVDVVCMCPPRKFRGTFVKVDDKGFIHVRRDVPLCKLVPGEHIDQTRVRTALPVKTTTGDGLQKVSRTRAVVPPAPTITDHMRPAFGPDVIKDCVQAFSKRRGAVSSAPVGSQQLDSSWKRMGFRGPRSNRGELVLMQERGQAEITLAEFRETHDGTHVFW